MDISAGFVAESSWKCSETSENEVKFWEIDYSADSFVYLLIDGSENF